MIELTENQVKEFFAYVGKDYKHQAKALFYQLQYYYGRRSEEIVRLRVCDIDFERNRITFPVAKKRDKEASINLVLLPQVADALAELAQGKGDEDYLFIEDESKKDAYKRTVRRYLERNSFDITKELFGIGVSLNTHDFRRMRGQHIYLQGGKLEHIQKMYQHQSIDQTIVYLQIDEIIVDNLLLTY